MVHTHGDANGIVQDRMEEEVRIVQYQVGIHLHAIDSSLNSKLFPSQVIPKPKQCNSKSISIHSLQGKQIDSPT